MTAHVEARTYSGRVDVFDITAREYPRGKKFVLENNAEVTICDGHSWGWKSDAVASPAGTIWTEVEEIFQRRGEHVRDTQLSVDHHRVGQGAAFSQREDTQILNQGGYETVTVIQAEEIKP